MRMREWNFLGDWVSPRHPGQREDQILPAAR